MSPLRWEEEEEVEQEVKVLSLKERMPDEEEKRTRAPDVHAELANSLPDIVTVSQVMFKVGMSETVQSQLMN